MMYVLKKFGSIFALIVLLCSIATPKVSALGAVDIDRPCSITVTLKGTEVKDPEFLLYQLFFANSQTETGDIHFDVNADYVDCITSALQKMGVVDVQEENLAEAILNLKSGDKQTFSIELRNSILLGEYCPLITQRGNNVVFEGLSAGIYLVMASSERISPGVVALPYYVDSNEITYDVEMAPKEILSDSTGAELPSTGGKGIYGYAAAGLVSLVAGAILSRKKRLA